MVAEDAHDTEGEDDDEQEKESQDNADYCDDQCRGVSACVCEYINVVVVRINTLALMEVLAQLRAV